MKTNQSHSIFYIFLLSVTTLFISSSSTKLKNLSNNEALSKISAQETKMIQALSGTNMTSFTIEAGQYNEASFRFGCESNFFAFTSRGKTKDFVISNLQKPVISINKDNDIMLFSETVQADKGFTFTGDLKIRGVHQWKLVHEESFEKDTTKAWSNNTVSECGGVSMLGGYGVFSRGEVEKEFKNLPKHNNVRIQANFHFIDAWNDESGYMKLNHGREGIMQYIWVERYSAFVGSKGINVCGGKWPEGKFSSPIDVTIPHKKDNLKIAFGSTLDQDGFDQSYGISGVRIFIR